MSYDVYFVRQHPPENFEDVSENEHPLKQSPDLRSRLTAEMNTPEVFEGSDGKWELTDSLTSVQVNYAPDGVGIGVSYGAATSDEFDTRVEHLKRLAKIIEEETGLTAWDPQADAVFSDVTLDQSRRAFGEFESVRDDVESEQSEQSEQSEGPAEGSKDESNAEDSGSGMLREVGVLLLIALVLYCITQNFIARPYLIPSESMEPTLHGCRGCTGDRIMVDKVVFRLSDPEPGEVVVFKGPPEWNGNYKSIRSSNTAVRYVQNALSFIGVVPPDENDLVKRVIATGGQTVECRPNTGLTVNGKKLNEPYLDPETIGPNIDGCWGFPFGPITVPEGKLWMMGDNRTHSGDSRAHCQSRDRDAGLDVDIERKIYCTGDPNIGTVPVANVIGKARFIAWPPGRWGAVKTVNPQT
ncbi:signal peptidase I [Mycobacteroides franklinii]|uniref:Signal peptidase I n=1 Tax=Mycobacteroides franklinii TaxID=948102 RepID=A0A4R5P486_9MYCO|nr:signal peptidase I [Mycobacteroides franklinii]ORA62656.1 signal peptidase I [Mycobacteroides franklinii]TDH17758.1 signal peptidase I [Mycobacteroides franklinii]